jgi:hypothetical protein
MPDSLYMDYQPVRAAGQVCHDTGTNLAVTVDQTAPGCTSAARAFPAWQTSQAVLDLHSAHTEDLNGHVQTLHATGDGIQGSVDITSATDATTAGQAGSIV